MVFSVNTVLDSKDKKVNTLLNKPEFGFDKSIFDEAVAIINAENESFAELFSDIVNEDLIDKIKEIDFSSILSRIFDVFVSALGRLGSSFAAFLLNFANKDFQLKALKGKLANYRGDVRYTKPYYTYTNIQADSLPSIQYKREIDDIYYGFSDAFANNFGKANSAADLVSLFEDDIKSFDGGINSGSMNKIRGSLVGTSSVSSSDFQDALFRYFRDGEMNRTEDKVKMFEKNIDGNRIAVAYKDYYSANKQIAIINREGFKYRAEALAAKAKIRTFNPLHYINKSLINGNTIIAYNRMVSTRCRQIKYICDTYLLYFAAKIDAIREYNKTNKEILLLAAKQMTREAGNND